MNRQPTLHGPGFRLVPLGETHRAPLREVARDPLLWAQHPVPERSDPNVFDAWFDSLLQRGGSLALVMEDGRVAGSSSFSNYREEGAGALEIGSTFLARDLWGGPVNRAMKQVMLRHAFVHVALVEFLIGEDNVRSRRAVEKIGARLTDRVVVMHAQGRDIAHLVYEIARRNFNGELPAR